MFSTVESVTGMTTRSAISRVIKVPKYRLKTCKGNIKVRGPMYHNTIPLDIREAKTVRSFKNRLRKLKFLDVSTQTTTRTSRVYGPAGGEQ